MSLLLPYHSETLEAQAAAIKAKPQSLLIVGEDGLGSDEFTDKIVASYSKEIIQVHPTAKTKGVRAIISVETIRELYQTTRAKTANETGRVIYVREAHTMTHQAQNAFLKLLEEPSSSTSFVLVAASLDTLLPTIISRCQIIRMRPLSRAASLKFMQTFKAIDPTRAAQIMFIASGKPALMSRLARDDTYFEQQKTYVQHAKILLGNDTYLKLLLVNEYKDSRPRSVELLLSTARMGEQLIKTGNHTDIAKKMNAYIAAVEQIERNANLRLVLINCML
ncbi:hypothetical protein FJZ39_01180 [Candidatus Saccharibacteria bacterium]|nr:hypothetical protein [Candidatus Saccharibacteria bacterium]